MDKFYHSIRLGESLYKGCINCIKRCPTKAIRVQDGRASISGKFCIDYGECIQACPHHAKLATYDKLDVIKKYRYTVALSAPSPYSQFGNLGNMNIMLSALLLVDFDGVFGVSAVVELVNEAIRQYIPEHEEQLPLVSTVCPFVARLIRARSPSLIPHLLPINPPVKMAAILAVKKTTEDTRLPREETGTMFTSPYPFKVTYVKSPLGTEESKVDQMLIIKDVYPKLLACIKTMVGEDYPVIGASGKVGISWGYSGGEASGLFTESHLAAGNIESVICMLEDIEDQKFINLRFAELNAYNDGCVGDTLAVENPYVAEVKLKRLRKHMPATRSHMHESEKNVIKWTVGTQYEPVFRLGNNMMRSFPRLNQVGRLTKKFPGLNCGSCGAPICKALTEDTARGDADEAGCAYYLWGNLRKLSEGVTVLADDLYNGDRGGQETLYILEEYMQRISNEMSVLDKKDEDKN